MKALFSRVVMLAIMTVVLGACATTPPVVEPPKRFFWPPEPDEPKIEWIDAYYGDQGLAESTFMTSIIGEDYSIVFKRPIGVAGDGEGRFVVSDQQLGQVFLFDLNKHKAYPLGGEKGAADFTIPSGVAVDKEGFFYVADTFSRKVFVVSNTNTIIRVLDLSEQVKSIGNISIDRARATLAVPDGKGGKVLLFSLTGGLLKTIDGKGYFSMPNAVAVTSDGSLLIADSYNATIVRFSADGKYLSSIGKRGDSAGNLTLVTGVAVDSEDHIYATDGRLHNVTIFDKEGNTLLVIGGQFSTKTGNIARGGFQIPQNISIDKNDRIYVADSFNQRIQVLQYLNQRYLEDHPINPNKQLK